MSFDGVGTGKLARARAGEASHAKVYDRSEYQVASETDTTASDEDQKLPPNHLGGNVPEGFSIDFESKNKGKMSEQNSTVKNVSTDGADEGKFGQTGLLDQQRSPSGPPKAAPLRGSRASISAPTKERIFNPHAQNPGRIPTAGGVSVGSKQYEQRRASMVSSDMGMPKSPPQSPTLVEESPAESSKDGAMNGAAAPSSGGGDAPAFNIPSYDKDAVAPDAQAPSSTMEPTPAAATTDATPSSATEPAPAPATDATPTTTDAKPVPAPAADAQAPSSALEPAPAPATDATPVDAKPVPEQTTTTTEDKPSTTEKLKETVKDKLPEKAGGTSNSTSSPASPSKERRGSRFDAFKDKLGLSSKK